MQREHRTTSPAHLPRSFLTVVDQMVESRVGAVRNRLAVARFPAPAHQTGRAELPHPAFRQTSARAHAERHRTGRNAWTPNAPKTDSRENWRVPRECVVV